MKRKVCVIINNRANYSSIKSAMRAIKHHADLELQLVVGASALLDRFGSVIELIQSEGFDPDATVHMIIEGETPLTMAKSTGLGLLELATIFDNLKPDIVMAVGDRFETMATAIAAAYMNIPLAHTMGGEVSGTIDESIRHAVTKLAHIHFPANQRAAERIKQMGEDPKSIHLVGCPRIDLVIEIMNNDELKLDNEYLNYEGVGGEVNTDEPFLLVSQHPVTTEYGQGEYQIHETLMALHTLKMPTIMMWPNVDAGSEDISRGIRKYREKYEREHGHIRFYKNFPLETYVQLMLRCACIMGNSSSAIREGSTLGTPAVNIGTRQRDRERGRNVIDVNYNRDQIINAVNRQMNRNRYPPEYIYGDGHAGVRVADILAHHPLNINKRFV